MQNHFIILTKGNGTTQHFTIELHQDDVENHQQETGHTDILYTKLDGWQ
jgi:hypothetical protein